MAGVKTGNEMVAELDLTPHPEGGWFKEIHRGVATVEHSDGRMRSTGTLIYYLLDAGSVSRWHRVESDEYWVHVDGDPLALHQADHSVCSATELGPPSQGRVGATWVEGGRWQAARSLGAWSLMSCAVAPGFDFADFTLFDPADPDHQFLRTVAAEAGDAFFG
jgi:predicted cupin superfamily sugar epimerase